MSPNQYFTKRIRSKIDSKARTLLVLSSVCKLKDYLAVDKTNLIFNLIKVFKTAEYYHINKVLLQLPARCCLPKNEATVNRETQNMLQALVVNNMVTEKP